MKTFREVCKIAGIGRQVLRGYADKDLELVLPTVKTDNGWLYDDNAVRRVLVVRTFQEAGYTRKQIKELLESPEVDLVAEYDRLIEMLLEKQRAIANMITIARGQRAFVALPESVQMAWSSVDWLNVFKNRSQSSYINEFMKSRGDSSEEEQDDYYEIGQLLTIHVIAIACTMKEGTYSEQAQQCVHAYYDLMLSVFKELASENEKAKFDAYSFAERSALIVLYTEYMMNTDKWIETVELYAGAGSVDFVVEAVKAYAEIHSDAKEFQRAMDKVKEDFDA